MTSSLTILRREFRYDPDIEAKREPRFDAFSVPLEKGLRVRDALTYARDQCDPVADLEERIRVEPLSH